MKHLLAILIVIENADNAEPYEQPLLKNYVREDNPPNFFIEAELETL